MKLRSWPAVVGGLSCLLLLILVSSEAIRRKARQIYDDLDRIHSEHRKVESNLQLLRSDISLSGIFVRDFLLDNSFLTGPAYRERLIGLRMEMNATLQDLRKLVSPTEAQRLENLQAKLDDYWEAYDPLFDWTPKQKLSLSSIFLLKRVLPRRDAVLDLARDIEAFNDANMKQQRAQVDVRENELRRYFRGMLWITLSLGTLIALTAGIRFHIVERRVEEQHRQSEQAEEEMRRLSQQLVRAHEEERKSLSRELHDQVGQMLTALRLEVGHAERARDSKEEFEAHSQECKRLIDTIVSTVRDLSMGLRPSMLDDFGLGPALQWHARDFSRRSNIPVNVELGGNLDALPDAHRTCIYRVVQEALTNCARHSGASRIDISVDGSDGKIELWVRDNGVGLDPNAKRSDGLGLVGIQERVRELHGHLSIHSGELGGTALHIDLPLEESRTEVQFAYPAG